MAPDPVLQRRLDAFWKQNSEEVSMSDERCSGTMLKASGPLPETHTQGCGGQCRVIYHYFNDEEVLQRVELCAVCDRVYDFPRFL